MENKKRKGTLKQAAKRSLEKKLHKRKIEKQNILTLTKMVAQFNQVIDTFPDYRIGSNTTVKIKDATLGAFSIFFTQSPSFLSYQEAMQKTEGQNNAQSLFGVYKIHSPTRIRELLDYIEPSYVFPMFRYIHDGLKKSGYLDDFRSYNDNLLVGIDGVQYFSSKENHCDNCSRKKNQDGSLTYFHSAVTPVILQPGNNKVLPLHPEFIVPQDGSRKQDCEITAAKRWLERNGAELKLLGATILGDDLYSKQPYCELLLEQGLDFILTCKKESHQTLYEYLQFQEEDIQVLEKERWRGKKCYIDTYRFFNGLALRDSDDALEVNWCEIITMNKDTKKVVYKNSFTTNFEIHSGNVKQVVADGRARWKVENENNNTLKNLGYHLEHNFGHGKKYLSSLFVSFNILAYLVHTVLDLMDEKYSLIRRVLPTRKTFFDDLRALTRYFFFNSWDELMMVMINGLKLDKLGDDF